AFDTLYAEGQRRYIESLSTYAKQFLDRMPKPLVDAIEGISPAVAIEQKNPTTSSRSTVGTATEIYDFLRLLWARVGTQHCVKCGHEVKADTVQEVVDALIADCGLAIADSTGRTPDLQSAIRNPKSAIVLTFLLPPMRRRPRLHRLRGRARTRRAAHRPRPQAEPGGGRAGPGDQATLGRSAPHPGRGGARPRHPTGYGVVRAGRAGPPLPATRGARWLPRDVPVPRASGGEAVQAVHPRLPTPVSARQDVPRVRRGAPQARGARRAGPRQNQCGNRGSDGRHPPRLDRGARAGAIPTGGGGSHSGGARGARLLRQRRRARVLDARPSDPDAVGRRSAAHCALERARLTPRGHAVRAG